MVNTALLRETFQRLKDLSFGISGRSDDLEQCRTCVGKAVNLLVDETYPKIRLLPNYEARLRGSVEAAFVFINEMVDAIPGAVVCSRKTYLSDPRTNAFFASPEHVSEVFSSSQEVRELFDAYSGAQECWGLLCMRKKDSRRLGVALQGDEVRREVLQTSVSFSDHQVVSPGCTEDEARQALKCCIFRSLAVFIQRQIARAKRSQVDRETRRRVLNGRLRSTSDQAELARLKTELKEVEAQPPEGPAFNTLEDYLVFITTTLQNPGSYVNCRNFEMHITRMGIEISDPTSERGLLLPLTEISVASHLPRIAALARFPRSDLLPERDFMREASLFLVS